MAGQDADFRVEQDQALHDGADQVVIFPIGKVRPPDGAGEQGVAAEEDIRLADKIAHAAGRMAGRGDDLETDACDVQRLSVLDGRAPEVRRRGGEPQAPGHVRAVVQHDFVGRVHEDGNAAEAVLQGLDAEDVVEVAVREQDGGGRQGFLREQIRERLQFAVSVAARVDDDAGALVLPDDIGALLEGVAGEGADIEHSFTFKDWQIYKTCVNFV